MKTKKLLVALTVVSVAAASVFTFPACHNHEYEWETVKPATCTETGEKVGTCKKDGDKVHEEIPVDPNNHVYGEWEIEKPEAENTGLAVKKCTKNAEHTPLNVTLPVLSSSDYTKTSSEASEFKSGKTEYKLANQSGDIAFTVVDTVATASVSKAVEESIKHKADVRGGAVAAFAAATVSGRGTEREINYEYGEDYTYYVENYSIGSGASAINVKNEGWFEDDGTFVLDKNGDVVLDDDGNEVKDIFALVRNSGGLGKFDLGDDIKAGMLTGYAFELNNTYIGSQTFQCYGAEGLVSTLYGLAVSDDAGNLATSKAIKEETTWFTFHFYIVGDYYGSQKLYDITVSFTLSDENALDKVNVTSYGYGKGEESDPVWTETEDEEGLPVYELAKPEAEHSTDKLAINQIALSELSAEDKAKVPTNPYTRDMFLASSFSLTHVSVVGQDSSYNNIYEDVGAIEENGTINAASGRTVYIRLDNILPETFNTDFDSVKVYEIVEGTNEEKAVSSWYSASDSILMINNVTVQGVHNIKVKTAKVTKSFKIDMGKGLPDTLSIWGWTEAYGDEYFSEETTRNTVWIGETVNVQPFIGHDNDVMTNYYYNEAARDNFPDIDFGTKTLVIRNAAGEDVSSQFTFANVKVNGIEWGAPVVFDATAITANSNLAAGVYKVYLVSSLDGSYMSEAYTLTYKVMPTLNDLLNGTYKAGNSICKLSYNGAAGTVTLGEETINFTATSEDDLTITDSGSTHTLAIVNHAVVLDGKTLVKFDPISAVMGGYRGKTYASADGVYKFSYSYYDDCYQLVKDDISAVALNYTLNETSDKFEITFSENTDAYLMFDELDFDFDAANENSYVQIDANGEITKFVITIGGEEIEFSVFNTTN